MNSIYFYPYQHDDEYVISIGRTNNLLTTPGGNLITSSNEEVISNIIYDLQRYEDIELDENNSITGAPIEAITSYALLCTEIDFWSGDRRLESEEIEARLGALMDPLTNLSPGPEQVDQLHQWRSVIDLLKTFGYNFMELQYFAKDKKQINSLANQISKDFNSGNRSEKSVFINILTIFGSPILSWSFCFHRLSELKIANALTETANFQFSLAQITSDEFENQDTGNDTENPSDSDDALLKKIRNKKRKEQIDETVQILHLCRNFIDINTDKIEEDENNEFKKTFALDVKTRKREKYIIEECITTIAGFLNTQGGTLFIGVNDDGKIVGIKEEVELLYKNNDKFLLNFKDIVKSKIEEKFFTLISYQIVKNSGKEILKVFCKKSNAPIFINKDEFYMRVNPATQKLTGMDLFEYLQTRFKDPN